MQLYLNVFLLYVRYVKRSPVLDYFQLLYQHLHSLYRPISVFTALVCKEINFAFLRDFIFVKKSLNEWSALFGTILIPQRNCSYCYHKTKLKKRCRYERFYLDNNNILWQSGRYGSDHLPLRGRIYKTLVWYPL